MFLAAWKKRNVIKTTGARNTPKFINLISTLNMAALFPTRSVIQKKMMKKHGLKLEILRGPTQSGVCSVKNWYIYIYIKDHLSNQNITRIDMLQHKYVLDVSHLRTQNNMRHLYWKKC